VRAVRLERAGGENDHRPLAREGVHGGARELFEKVMVKSSILSWPARYSSFRALEEIDEPPTLGETRVAV
jgi:hypothetical protein